MPCWLIVITCHSAHKKILYAVSGSYWFVIVFLCWMDSWKVTKDGPEENKDVYL